MKFNEKIVRLRKIKGITQDEFANAVGVSRQAVYKWESGQSYPEVAKLLEIKLLFNISIDDLLDDNFDIAMPEKKKRKRTHKPVEKKPVAEVKAEEIAPEEQIVAEAPVTEPVVKETEPVLVEKAGEAAPEVIEAPVEENKAPEKEELNADEKKRGFFGRLFGRK